MTPSWQLWGRSRRDGEKWSDSGWARTGEEVGLWWGEGGGKGGEGLSLGGFFNRKEDS